MAFSSTLYPTYASYTTLIASSTAPANSSDKTGAQLNKLSANTSQNTLNGQSVSPVMKSPSVGRDYYNYSNVAAVQTSPNTIQQTSLTISEDGPPPTLVMRAFRDLFNQAVNWIYNVDNTATSNNQQSTYNKAPVYHIFIR